MFTEVCATITGTVWKILVKPGESVEAEQVLMILESMKMEFPIEAPCAGIVASLAVAENDAVQEEQVVATLA